MGAPAADHPIAAIWPPARLRIRTPRLELRVPTDEELVELASITDDVHDPGTMPFASPWSDAPAAERGRLLYEWHCRHRTGMTPGNWALLFGVFEDGRPIGAQDIGATDFPVRREVATGSWLGRPQHGRGLGTEMRRAVLHLAFEHLGALAATTGAYEDNAASIRVSEKCGYARNGVRSVIRSRGAEAPGGPGSERATEVLFRMERDAWRAHAAPEVEVTGLDDDLRAMLGAVEPRG